jgi:general secretion pathway protein D
MRAQQRDTAITTRGDSVTIRLIDVELQVAVQALARYLDRPVVVGSITGTRITLETPQPVPRADVPRLLRGVLESQSYELLDDSVAGLYRVRPREVAPARPVTAPEASGGRPMQGPLQLFVIHLRHARASEVAASVSALYNRGGALGELGARQSTLRRELQEGRIPPGLPGENMPAEAAIQRPAALAGEITIVPDSRTNSLLVRASQRDYELINAAVQELDVRPLQVLIEVFIAEVRMDRSLEFGVDTRLPRQRVRGSDNTTIEGETRGAPGLDDLIVRVLGIGGAEVDVTLRAAAARGDVSIVSRPVIIAANNEVAEINVGSERPFVQVARVLPTDNTARDQVVQYKDVGTRLRVTPTISPDGYVMLQVIQEVNAATNESSGLSGVQAPVISTRSIETRLLVKDRQTVVLGGLSDRQRDRSQGGVPILSSIPLIGGLFGSVHRRTVETELYLFLTPHVLRNDEESENITTPLEERARQRAKP